MERVLEILLQVENLTVDEKAQVQNGLSSIRSDINGTPSNINADSEIFSDLSVLINIRYGHQSEEEARAV
jgi:hypothetical protein